MDLDVVLVLFVISDHKLNVRIFEWNGERVVAVFFLVLFDLFCIVGVLFNIFDDLVAEDNLREWVHQTIREGGKPAQTWQKAIDCSER